MFCMNCQNNVRPCNLKLFIYENVIRNYLPKLAIVISSFDTYFVIFEMQFEQGIKEGENITLNPSLYIVCPHNLDNCIV